MIEELEQVAGMYNLVDYQRMFNLTEQDLNKKIFNFPAGIATFNAEMALLGKSVVSADGNYQLTPGEIDSYVKDLLEKIKVKLKNSQDKTSPSVHIKHWQRHAQQFLQDYPSGKIQARYEAMEIPQLPVGDQHFELALCAYQKTVSEQDFYQLVSELARIAKEARIFSVHGFDNEVQTTLGPVLLKLQQQNYQIKIMQSQFSRRPQANALLCVQSPNNNN